MKRMLTSRATWFLAIVVLTMFWWINGGTKELDAVRLGAAGFGKDLFQSGVTQDLQLFPPSNPKIHVSLPYQLAQKHADNISMLADGQQPPINCEKTGRFQVKNTTSLLLSLRNTPETPSSPASKPSANPSASVVHSNHISFRLDSASNKPALPVSLIARVDQEEYVLLPNASALVAICSGNLQRDAEHNIRIIAPMTDDHGRGILQLEGLWLSKGGQFEHIEGTPVHGSSNDEDLSAESDQVGERHRTGLSKLLKGSENVRSGVAQEVLKESDESQDYRSRRKMLEVLSDMPGSSGRRKHSTRVGAAHGLLAGVLGWEYLLGEMFSIDHAAIAVDGMCLIQDCILNLGNSDQVSFDSHASTYNKSAWDLAEGFENTYVSLVKAIRTLAYPKHPTTIQSELSDYKIYIPNSVPASIPIFVMRPFRGELEHSTQNIVNRLRADGDTGVFWLDTSGWLNPNVSPNEESSNQDFYLDNRGEPPSKWRLTERGNQRVAIFLHMHVCRYLAREGEKCPFLPAEMYQGKVFDPAERDFERYVEGEKERKLKKLFWGEEEGDGGEGGGEDGGKMEGPVPTAGGG
ncbi:MAG: hypothetical protein Q9219_006244 [cf. Caloplaca sp. 3 TL-2023]